MSDSDTDSAQESVFGSSKHELLAEIAATKEIDQHRKMLANCVFWPGLILPILAILYLACTALSLKDALLSKDDWPVLVVWLAARALFAGVVVAFGGWLMRLAERLLRPMYMTALPDAGELPGITADMIRAFGEAISKAKQ